MSRDERASHRIPPRGWLERLAHLLVIAIPVAAYAAAHFLLVPVLLDFLGRATHGSPRWMTVAGWATAALAPAALLVLLLGYQRREVQLGDDLLNRSRASHGHAVRGLGVGRWISRIPLVLILLLFAVFTPTRGTSGPAGWDVMPGGAAFHRGWRVSVSATLLALLAVLILFLPAMFPGRGLRILQVAGLLIVVAAPALSLLVLYA